MTKRTLHIWIDVLQAYKQSSKKKKVENLEELFAEPLFCKDSIQVRSRSMLQKLGLTMEYFILKVF